MYGWVSYKDHKKVKNILMAVLIAAPILVIALIVMNVYLLVQRPSSSSMESIAFQELMIQDEIISLNQMIETLQIENDDLASQLVRERKILLDHLYSVTKAINSIESMADTIEDKGIELQSTRELLEEYADDVLFLSEILALGRNTARVDFYDLRVTSNTTEAQLNILLRGSPLEGYGWYFLAAERHYGVNAMILIGIVRQESGLGRFQANTNNIAGIKNTNGTWRAFDSMIDCINFLARLLANSYLAPNGRFNNGTHLEGVNVRYAVMPDGSPDWGWSSAIRQIVTRDLTRI